MLILPVWVLERKPTNCRDSNVCTVCRLARDPEELIPPFQSEGCLPAESLPLGGAPSMGLLMPSADWLKLTHILEGNLFPWSPLIWMLILSQTSLQKHSKYLTIFLGTKAQPHWHTQETNCTLSTTWSRKDSPFLSLPKVLYYSEALPLVLSHITTHWLSCVRQALWNV